MAITSKGILGRYYGKVGEVVGSSWRGIHYVKSLPKRIKRATSEKILNQQAKFRVAVNFLTPLHEFIKNSYNDKKQFLMTANNNALGEVLRNAVIGNLPNIKIDYSKVVISKGKLPPLIKLSFVRQINKVDLKWGKIGSYLTSVPDSPVKFVIYVESKNVFLQDSGATRSSSEYSLSLESYEKGDKVVIWVLCTNKELTKFSNSVYLGEFIIQ